MLNTTYITMAQAFALVDSKNSSSNKEEFLKVFDKLKYRDTYIKESKALGDAARATIVNESSLRAYQVMIRMSKSYMNIPDRLVNINNIDWVNLKAVVSLSNYITKHYEGDMTLIKSLEGIWQSGMSASRYNNLLKARVKKLKEDNKVEEILVLPTYDEVVVEVNTLTSTDKVRLLEVLMEELGYEVLEAA